MAAVHNNTTDVLDKPAFAGRQARTDTIVQTKNRPKAVGGLGFLKSSKVALGDLSSKLDCAIEFFKMGVTDAVCLDFFF